HRRALDRGRPLRIPAQAGQGSEGQRPAAAWPRRGAGSHRRPGAHHARVPAALAGARPMKRITTLGATGSIGDSTLDVIARNPGRYQVHALTANGNVDKLIELARRHDAAVI